MCRLLQGLEKPVIILSTAKITAPAALWGMLQRLRMWP